jgi:ring-1,2-phenylacetyl-CoA epoxidase subunit PaaC
VIRLGDGTSESNARINHAIDYLWNYTGELFEPFKEKLPELIIAC